MAGKKKNTAFMRPVNLSPELEAITGPGPMPRTEVTKKLWEYIKKHDRQDPKNKRNIVPDDKLAKLFGTKSAVNMFKMTSLVNKHMEAEPAAAK